MKIRSIAVVLRRFAVGLTAVALAAPVLAAKTDRIQFADTLIIGEVKTLERGTLTITTDYTKKIQADWDEVLQVESKITFEVEDRDGGRYFGTLAASGEDRVLVVEQEDGAVVRLPFSEVVSINQTKTDLVGKIEADVSLGFSFVQATETTQATLDAGFTRRTKRFFTRVHLLAIVSDTAEEQSSRSDLSYTAMRNLPGRWTFDVAGQSQSNESLGLDQRWLVRGSGVFRTVRTDIRELLLGAGLAVSREEYIGEQPGDNNLEGTLSVRYFAFHFDDPELEVTTALWVFPSLTTTGRVRVEFDTNVRRELVSDLFWSLNLYWTFDSDPPSGNQKDDLTVSFALGWKL